MKTTSQRRFQVGYCTNVHAGTDLEAIRHNLEAYALPIAERYPERMLGVGLWLPASAASQLATQDQVASFGNWLSERRLLPFTINGFPYDNFHRPVVKHQVYLPSWADDARLNYTIQLAHIQAGLLSLFDDRDEPLVGTISTLPIGWPAESPRVMIRQAGQRFRQLASQLEQLESSSGRRILVAIEPEPGCLLDRCHDVIEFFENELPDANHRRYLGVCHDVCHSAVMFEPQADVLSRYADAGIVIGKVQVSSAIDLPLNTLSPELRQAAIEQLSNFAEERYLHQTGCLGHDGQFRLMEDLPQWLTDDDRHTDQRIRVHFHVPIFADRFAHLHTTQSDISACIRAIEQNAAIEFTGHFEIETYAWTVMPDTLRQGGLAADIERELQWFREVLFVSD